jgi:hypothetical protein
MAKADLQRLLAELETDVKAYRVETDKFPHVLRVSTMDIYKQILAQLKLAKPAPIVPTGGQFARIARLSLKAYSMIKRDASRKLMKNTTWEEVDGVLYVYTSGLKSNFNSIKDSVTFNARNYLLEELNKTFSTNITSDDFLDTGHHKSVGELQVAVGVDNNATAQSMRSTLMREIPDLVDTYTIKSHFNARGDKVFEVYVELESAKVNRGKLEDKAKKARIVAGMQKFIASHTWAYQEASDSKVRQVAKTIRLAFNENAPKPNMEPSSVTKKVVTKVKTSNMGLDLSMKAIKPKKSSISLVNILNQKLPEEIRKRMTYPRLVYRTGRFAHSARVVSQVQNDTSITFAYTYQKNPYQIFEMGAGTAPWATPARDPRRIIDDSIRAIAKSQMEGRFYTRRI